MRRGGREARIRHFHPRLSQKRQQTPQTHRICRGDLLRLSNEIPDLAAGRQILQAPTVEDDLWDRLLVQPLKEVIAEAPTANVGKIARQFLDWLIDALDKQ